MRRLLISAMALLVTSATYAVEPDTRLYEMRVYYANEGKLDGLNKRFRDHTVKLFEKHGLTNVGYWVPVDNKENKLVYVISAKDKAARDASFKAFGADPIWQAAAKESEKDGKLVKKITSTFLTATDYSPALKVEKTDTGRVFELRTYTASPENLGALNDRFRNHTIKLFEKHGMQNLVYWNYTKGLKQKNEDDMLVYLLAHKSPEAMKASFDTFRTDPDWVKARAASEEKAKGSLTAKENGVVSEVLKPTDYSPWK